MQHFDCATLYTDGGFFVGEVEVSECSVCKKNPPSIIPLVDPKNSKIFIVPGFVDVHTHLREPGFFYKESISAATAAAAKMGYCALFSMPNVNPVPDCVENLKVQQEIINRDARVKVYPYGALTIGQKGETPADLEGLAPHVIAFSDDGHGVQNDALMEQAMNTAARLNKIIASHCEEESLLFGGYIHDGDYAKTHGHKGISSKSEWSQLKRDLELVKKTGCRYHVCHVSTKESVKLIRDAKKQGLPVTAETAPHYLVLTDADLLEDGRFKMNPPLRAEDDRQAIIEGLNDGTIDVIATDHAPHSAEEKSRGLSGSAFGIVGLETAFPLLYTKLVMSGKVSLGRLIDAMSVRPREIFGLPKDDGWAVLDLTKKFTVDSRNFLSKGKSTPFDGYELYGVNTMTILNGETIWKNA